MWNRVYVYEGVWWYAKELRQAKASKIIYKKIGQQNKKGLMHQPIHVFLSFLRLSKPTHISNPLEARHHDSLCKVPSYLYFVLLPQRNPYSQVHSVSTASPNDRKEIF